jgi:hypothetical protein
LAKRTSRTNAAASKERVGGGRGRAEADAEDGGASPIRKAPDALARVSFKSGDVGYDGIALGESARAPSARGMNGLPAAPEDPEETPCVNTERPKVESFRLLLVSFIAKQLELLLFSFSKKQ